MHPTGVNAENAFGKRAISTQIFPASKTAQPLRGFGLYAARKGQCGLSYIFSDTYLLLIQPSRDCQFSSRFKHATHYSENAH